MREVASRSGTGGRPCPFDRQDLRCVPVVDHIQALKHGDQDEPSNMQWQTLEAAKGKDKWG